ncbi:unnamed protein product [Symbiodinium microadriaticum]|nr:unnamed protein product [Symbiodinium microadriaticum]
MSLAKFGFDIDLMDFGYEADSNSDTSTDEKFEIDVENCDTKDDKSQSYEPSESEVIQIKQDLERDAETAARTRHKIWLQHRQSLENSIREMFKEHLEIYEKAQALRLHFEAEQMAWTQKINTMCNCYSGNVEKRKLADFDASDEFPYELPVDRMHESSIPLVDIFSLESFETPPPPTKKLQKKFHTPFKNEK